MFEQLRKLFSGDNGLTTELFVKKDEVISGGTVEAVIELQTKSKKKRINSIEAILKISTEGTKDVASETIASLSLANNILLKGNEKHRIEFFVSIPEEIVKIPRRFPQPVEAIININGKTVLKQNITVLKQNIITLELYPKIKRIISAMRFFFFEFSEQSFYMEDSNMFIVENILTERKLGFTFSIKETGVLCHLIRDSFNGDVDYNFFVPNSLDESSLEKLIIDEFQKFAPMPHPTNIGSHNQLSSTKTEISTSNTSHDLSYLYPLIANTVTSTVNTDSSCSSTDTSSF